MNVIASTKPCVSRAQSKTSYDPDPAIVYTLVSALRHPAIRERLYRIGPDVLVDSASRFVARAIVCDSVPETRSLSNHERARVDVLVSAVLRTYGRGIIGIDADEAAHWLRVLAERSHRPLLASALVWSAERVREGRPIAWVRREVSRAFDVAEGRVSIFDAVSGEGRAACANSTV